jgi:hypothetical protein
MKSIVFVAVMALVLAAPAQAADTGAMARAATDFYAAYASFHQRVDGIPGAKARMKFAPVISDRLNGLIVRARAVEEKFTNAYKDSPPLVEGDLFTSNYEGATSYKVGACAGDGESGHCAVALTYDPHAMGDTRNKPVHWTDTAYLVNAASGWKLDDIGFGGNWDYANKGKVSQTLEMVIETAGGGND